MRQRLKEINYIEHLIKIHNISVDSIIESLKRTNTLTELKTDLNEISHIDDDENLRFMRRFSDFNCMFSLNSLANINQARELIGLPDYVLSEEEKKKIDDDDRDTSKVIRKQKTKK